MFTKEVTMWEPIVKDNKLYGLSLNPLGKKPMILRDSENSSDVDTVKAWVKEEANRRLVEVDDEWFKYSVETDVITARAGTRNKIGLWYRIHKSDVFTADESNGKLINIKIT